MTHLHPKKLLGFIFFSALFLSLWGFEKVGATPPAGYVLTWSDEFNGTVGTAPNPANWGYDVGASGWGNSELENYTTSTANSQIVADINATDGLALAIIAIDTTPGSGAYNTVGRYTSARLNSSGRQSFQYGWMEARIQVPTGKGFWPAFWMLGTNIGSVGWPTCGETDIMEQIGNACCTGTNYGSMHDGMNWSTQYFLPAGQYFYTQYHTYSANWQANQVQFYVDNNLYETVNASTQTSGTWEFNHPFFFLLNVAVGGTFPGGAPDATASFPQTMLVDYVRVYEQLTPTPTVTFTPTATFTPTSTPTPCTTCPPTATPTFTPLPGASTILYPNPSRGGPVSIHSPSQTSVSDIKVQVFTVGYRKVLEQVFPQVAPGTDVSINMTDNWNSLLSNGLYYVVVTGQGQSVLKLLLLR